MTSKMAVLISVLAILIYTYLKTKDKITLIGLSVALLTLLTGTLIKNNYFDDLFSYITFASPKSQKIVLLIIDFIVIIVFLGYVFYRSEKYKGSDKGKIVPDFAVLFERSRGNIIFWALIITFNIMVFLLSKSS